MQKYYSISTAKGWAEFPSLKAAKEFAKNNKIDGTIKEHRKDSWRKWWTVKTMGRTTAGEFITEE